MTACGIRSVRKHCSHEEYGLGARGRIYGATKVHHAGFSPACGSWDEEKVSTDESWWKERTRGGCAKFVHPHLLICFQIMHSSIAYEIIWANDSCKMLQVVWPTSTVHCRASWSPKVKILEAKSHFGKVQDWQWSPWAHLWRYPIADWVFIRVVCFVPGRRVSRKYLCQAP